MKRTSALRMQQRQQVSSVAESESAVVEARSLDEDEGTSESEDELPPRAVAVSPEHSLAHSAHAGSGSQDGIQPSTQEGDV